jgi:hypothetical protein
MCSAFSADSSFWHHSESKSALRSQAGNLDLLAAKLDVLQGVVKDLHRRQNVHQEKVSDIDNQHVEEVSVTERQNLDSRNTRNKFRFEADAGRLRQEQQSDKHKMVYLLSEIDLLSGNIKDMSTKLERIHTEIETANEIIAVERGLRAKNDESYKKRLRDLQIEYMEDRARLMSESESEIEKSARCLADVVMSNEEQARNEQRKKEEREEIAAAAVKSSQRRATHLEEKLVSSEKKVSRLRAQIKLQQLMMRAFLEEAT